MLLLIVGPHLMKRLRGCWRATASTSFRPSTGTESFRHNPEIVHQKQVRIQGRPRIYFHPSRGRFHKLFHAPTPIFCALCPTFTPLKSQKLGVGCKRVGVGRKPVYEINPRGMVTSLRDLGGGSCPPAVWSLIIIITTPEMLYYWKKIISE